MKKLFLPFIFLFICSTALAQYEPRSVYSAAGEVPPDNYLLMGDGSGGIEASSIGRTGNVSYVVTPHGNCGSTETFSAYTGFHTATLDANLTVTLSDFDTTGYQSPITIRFLQDATGNRTITWPGAVVTAPIINPTASSITTVTLETTDGGTTVYAHSDFATEVYEFALSDETTALTTGTAKLTWRAPYALKLVALRSSLTGATTTGLTTVDVNEAGTTLISTKLTIDATEKTSTTAATPYVISDADIADDALITFDVDAVGDGTQTGLKVKLYVYRQ